VEPVAARHGAPAPVVDRDGEPKADDPSAPAAAPVDTPASNDATGNGAAGNGAAGNGATGNGTGSALSDTAASEVSASGSSTDGNGADRDVARVPDAGSGQPDLVPVPGARFAELPVTSIRPNPRQPRQVFDEEALAELVHSVREIGVLQPVVVRQIEDEAGEPRFGLIMGERRLRATQEAGMERIPAIIRDTSDDSMLRDALLENLHRSQLNPLEEAAAYQQLLDDFGCTHEELATRIGRSRPQISNTIRLLRLPPQVQRRVAAGVLSAGHARAVLGLDDAAAMERLAQRIVSEGLSVRAVEEVVALGDGPVAKPARKRPRAGSHTSELDDLAARLGDRLDTRVSVALGRSRGRLSIDFASVEDLNRIVGLMAPEVKGAFQEAH
jgi:ParB family chromosome partitioning protein